MNPRYHSTENGRTESNGEANKEGTLLPKTEEKEFKIPEGALRDSIGYGDMNVDVTVIPGSVAVLSFVFIGGSPHFFSKAK